MSMAAGASARRPGGVRPMSDDFRYWHFKAAEALAASDTAAALALCAEASSLPALFDPDNPQDQVLRLAAARRSGNREWLAEAEASLVRNRGRWAPGSMQHEATVAAHHLCGLMRLSEPGLAAALFMAALELAPDFLPARVELEILRTGRDRERLFGALGAAPPREDWRYAVAAAELGAVLAPASAAQSAAAICLRGLCTPETPALLRLYRALNPQARIFLATWEATAAGLLEELRRHAEVTLVADTDNPGIQNRNRQLLLSQAVLRAAQAAGFSYALLARSDVALLQPDVLSQLFALHRGFPPPPGRLLGRLLVPDVFTRRYMPFHVSDILSFGALPDLLLQWGAPLFGAGETEARHWNEQYFHWKLYEALGLPSVEPDHPAYRDFLRDYFVVRDFDWFGGFWVKHPELRNGAALRHRDACISQSDWERLHYAATPAAGLNLMGALPNGVMLQSALDIHRYG